MKLPKKISVLGVTYYLKKQKTIDADVRKRKEQDETIGLFDPSSRTIVITKSPLFCDDLIEQTFFHELTHAILYDGGLDELISPEVEETFCQIFGNAMQQIYKQIQGV